MSHERIAPGATLAVGLPVTAGIIAAACGGIAAGWLAVACAVLAGVPAAFWALSTGRRRFHHWLLIGAVAGAVPLLVPLAAALIREVGVHGHTTPFEQGIGFVVAGMLSSLGLPRMTYFGNSLLWMEVPPILIGAATGTAYWLLFVRRPTLGEVLTDRGKLSLWPVVPITAGAAFIVALPLVWAFALLAAAIGAAAGLGAVPILAVALRLGLRRLISTMVLGGVTAAIGTSIWVSMVRWGGIPFVVTSTVIGATAGGSYWLAVLAPPEGRKWTTRLAALAPGLLFVIALMWPATLWPKYRERVEGLEVPWTFGTDANANGERQIRFWRSDAPECFGIIYSAELQTHLERAKPQTLALEIVHRHYWTHLAPTHEDAVLTKAGPVAIPRTRKWTEGCLFWVGVPSWMQSGAKSR